MVKHSAWNKIKRQRLRFIPQSIAIVAIGLFLILVSAWCNVTVGNIGTASWKEQFTRRTQRKGCAREKRLHNDSLEIDDYIYRQGSWDGAPIVVQEYKLLFFTVAKVGCTVWKQLFRRMAGYDNWKGWNMKSHDPKINGLHYLYDFTLQDANDMLTSKEWTKAIFVREPKARIVSAYLDKGKRKEGLYVARHCCGGDLKCGRRASESFAQFINVVLSNTSLCKTDPHWIRMTDRIDPKFIPYINFVGRFETLAVDAKRLLQRIGAWDDYGATGWGVNGDEPIFGSNAALHATNATRQLTTFFDSSTTEDLVDTFYAKDLTSDLFRQSAMTRVISSTKHV